MGIKTRSQFYFGHEIDKTQHFISIDEGGGELTVELTPSGYTFSELAIELERALNESGSFTYTVTANRSDRKYTISSTGVFSLLAGTGSYLGSDAYFRLGFNYADKTGLSTYTSDFSSGSVFRPQLPLFDYTPSSHIEGSLQATQDESGSGAVEVVSFGTVNYMECDIRFITNRKDKPDIIEYDSTAVETCMEFLSYIRKKNRVEFMPDRDDLNTFEKFILFKSAKSNTGIEVKLEEMSSMNIQDYYQTGLLTFRKVT